MIPITSKHEPNLDKDIDRFHTESENLSSRSLISQFSGNASVGNVFRESENLRGKATTINPVVADTIERYNVSDFTTDWVGALENEKMDLIINTSSLADESCSALSHDFGIEEDGTPYNLPFEEGIVDGGDSIGNYKDEHSSQSHPDPSKLLFRYAQDDDGKDSPFACTKHLKEQKSKGAAISYAQLFFDQENKTLVALMEISNCQKFTICDNNDHSGYNVAGCSSHVVPHKRDLPRGISLHRSSIVVTKNHQNDEGSHILSRNISNEWDSRMKDDDNRPFHDDTLSTECSSLSSVTYSKDDYDCHDTSSLPEMKPDPPPPTRFSDEPIVFSNDVSMEQNFCWLDEANIGLYLLHDCDDPWDSGVPTRESNARCGESIKKLLNASRFCISLVQLGELKWRVSSTYHNSSDPSHNYHNHKTKIDQTSYSILKDV